MRKIDRRDFMKLMGMVGLSAAAPWPMSTARAQSGEPYSGPIIISIAARGGWDPTSFCDPKVNVAGAPEINRWARDAGVQTIEGSPIIYAPFANNQEFFERFHGDLLVVNGIDVQTNSHDAGVRHNWSGRITPGYPSFSAIAAATLGPNLPLPFLTNSSYRETAGLTTYTEVSGVRDLQDLVDVNRVARSDRRYFDEDEQAILEGYQRERLLAQQARSGMLPRQQRALRNLASARSSRAELGALLVALPERLVNSRDKDGFRNPLLQQAQLSLVCAQAGLTVSCDLELGGFDTHGNHDSTQRAALQQLTNGITYVWDTAEELGLADRLTLFVTSDFGRTPHYNNGAGKDHWPVSSALFMQRNAAWTNRVVGASDAGHNALAINPTTLEFDDSSRAMTLHPAHLQQTFRKIVGIDTQPATKRFPLDAHPLV